MKKILAVAFLIMAFMSCATAPKVLSSEQLVVQKVFEVQKSKSELFVNSMDWIAHVFNSSKAVIEYSDSASGTIIGKASIMVPYKMNIPMNTHFTMLIEVKDNKARMRLDKAYVEVNVSNKSGKSFIDNEYSWGQFVKTTEAIFSSYEAKIAQKASW